MLYFKKELKIKSTILYVFVHPFDSYDVYNSSPRFNQIRELFFKDLKPVLFLSDKQNFSKVYQKISTNQYISLTKDSNAKLTESTYKKIISELKHKYNFDEIIVCGAELHLDESGKYYTGCVLDAFEQIQVVFQNTQIKKEFCLVNPDN